MLYYEFIYVIVSVATERDCFCLVTTGSTIRTRSEMTDVVEWERAYGGHRMNTISSLNKITPIVHIRFKLKIWNVVARRRVINSKQLRQCCVKNKRVPTRFHRTENLNCFDITSFSQTMDDDGKTRKTHKLMDHQLLNKNDEQNNTNYIQIGSRVEEN